MPRGGPLSLVGLAAASADPSQLTGLVGWVADVIAALGPFGVFALVAVENVFPPIPSEVVLPFAGFLSGRGRGAPWAMTWAATAGSVVGAVVLYEAGRRVGRERTERWLVALPLVERDEVDRAIDWFQRHGKRSVFVGRMVPLVRSLVSLPAGAAHMPRGQFLVLTAAGSLLWNAIWVWAGYHLGARWQEAGAYSDWLNAGLTGVVVALVVRFVWRRRHRLRPG